jgi:ABC-type sugar transport system ATPase subunit
MIYGRPANVFVANFVGDREINLVRGDLAIHEGSRCVVGGGLRIALGHRQDSFAAGDRQVVLGVRAEGIRPTAAPAPADIPARVTGVERTGPEVVVFASAGEGIELCCRADAQAQFSTGQAIGLHFVPEHLHLFDADDEKSLYVPLADNLGGSR